MKEFVYPLIGIPLIFIATTLGALCVFFLRQNKIFPKVNKIFIGFVVMLALDCVPL